MVARDFAIYKVLLREKRKRNRVLCSNVLVQKTKEKLKIKFPILVIKKLPSFCIEDEALMLSTSRHSAAEAKAVKHIVAVVQEVVP